VTFNEVGDAGTPTDPMHVGPEGMLFDAIAGNLGDNGDTSDAFLLWRGGSPPVDRGSRVARPHPPRLVLPT
jgi:hypothetical protein